MTAGEGDSFTRSPVSGGRGGGASAAAKKKMEKLGEKFWNVI